MTNTVSTILFISKRHDENMINPEKELHSFQFLLESPTSTEGCQLCNHAPCYISTKIAFF